MKQKAGLPMIIGAVVLLALVIFGLFKAFGGSGGGSTVNPSVGGPPAYAVQKRNGQDVTAGQFRPSGAPGGQPAPSGPPR